MSLPSARPAERNPAGAFAELSAHVARLAATFPESVPEVVRQILQTGFRVGASDVHLEPLPDRMLVRFRIDGSLVEGATLDARARANIVARVKVLAGLMTYRTDIPQEGRIAASPGDDLLNRADLRVSVYPAIHGERAVIRFPAQYGGAEPSDGGGHALERLGFPADVLERLKHLLELPYGLILLTGPAGSGKTTTLYASLRHLHARWSGQRHIVTVEDPVERIVPGITQTQINPGVELDYAAALRALLRQDPEILMVGEIRDTATACMAAQAALTGHLLLSTLHAGTPVEVLLRLTQLGVEPYLAGSVVTGVLAQRLIRKLCKNCSAGLQPAPTSLQPEIPLHNGCDACHGTGFSGRLVACELLEPDDTLRLALRNRDERQKLAELALASGCAGLWARGMELVAKGLTTTQELRRAMAPGQ